MMHYDIPLSAQLKWETKRCQSLQYFLPDSCLYHGLVCPTICVNFLKNLTFKRRFALTLCVLTLLRMGLAAVLQKSSSKNIFNQVEFQQVFFVGLY